MTSPFPSERSPDEISFMTPRLSQQLSPGAMSLRSRFTRQDPDNMLYIVPNVAYEGYEVDEEVGLKMVSHIEAWLSAYVGTKVEFPTLEDMEEQERLLARWGNVARFGKALLKKQLGAAGDVSGMLAADIPAKKQIILVNVMELMAEYLDPNNEMSFENFEGRMNWYMQALKRNDNRYLQLYKSTPATASIAGGAAFMAAKKHSSTAFEWARKTLTAANNLTMRPTAEATVQSVIEMVEKAETSAAPPIAEMVTTLAANGTELLANTAANNPQLSQHNVLIEFVAMLMEWIAKCLVQLDFSSNPFQFSVALFACAVIIWLIAEAYTRKKTSQFRSKLSSMSAYHSSILRSPSRKLTYNLRKRRPATRRRRH